MIISTDTFDKMLYSLLLESQQTRNEGIFFNLIKCIYKKPSAGIILSGEQWNAFCLTHQEENDVPLSPFLFKILLGCGQ